MHSADVSGAASGMRIMRRNAVAVGVIAYVLVVACSAYAGALLFDVIMRYINSGMHICMGRVPLWGI